MSHPPYSISEMKPITKTQKEIVSLSKKLKPITDTQKRYAYAHCFEPFARRKAKGIYTCSDCAYSWSDPLCHIPVHVTCPHCGRKLKVNTERKKIYRYEVYYTVITVVKCYQVLRHFVVFANFRIGKPAQYSIREVVQRWLSPKGVTYTLALKRNMSFYYDSWNYGSDMELRSCPNLFVYNINTMYIYPKMKVTDTLKRNGFQGETYDLSHHTVFKALLSDNKMESLLKCGQISLFRYFAVRDILSDDIWKALKIAIRHKYDFPDVGLWCDYIKLLLHFGKDISNPHYACPANLRKEHYRLCRRKHEEEVRESLEQKKRESYLHEELYYEAKSRFFGLVISEGNIEIRVLESVQEFIEEGELMEHCVFSNEYFKDENSLILSAMVDGVKTETIEVSLETMEVVQCCGKCNLNSPYHDEILRVMNKNIHLIAKRMCG